MVVNLINCRVFLVAVPDRPRREILSTQTLDLSHDGMGSRTGKEGRVKVRAHRLAGAGVVCLSFSPHHTIVSSISSPHSYSLIFRGNLELAVLGLPRRSTE